MTFMEKAKSLSYLTTPSRLVLSANVIDMPPTAAVSMSLQGIKK